MMRIISRTEPNRLPSVPLPLYVRSVGYNEAAEGWKEFLPGSTKKFVQIFWCVEGRGEFCIGDCRRILGHNEFIYHLPGEDHLHTSLSPVWAYHWFTLDGPFALDFIRGYGYPRETMQSGPCPAYLFLQLEKLMGEMSPYSQRKMLSIAADILAIAGSGNNKGKQSDKVVKEFVDLVQTMYSDSSINVNILADRIGVHRTTLTRLFRKHMLISPGEYLLQLRIQRALSLLRETDHPVYRVGEMVGIPHRGYFCRLIQRTVGVSPKVYREQVFLL